MEPNDDRATLLNSPSAHPPRAPGLDNQTLPLFSAKHAREDFPALNQEVNGQPLTYLDSGATALKPQCVIDAVSGVYGRDCANVHRGVHTLSQRATAAYEGTRDKVQGFLGASAREEILFTRGTTEGVNLVASSYGQHALGEGDEVLITALEHHSNIVPWQLACERAGAKLVVAPITDSGEVLLEDFCAKLTERTKVAAFAHVSNALGTVLPVEEMTHAAHDAGAVVLIDGAQGAPHLHVDVEELGCDFYAFSAHKLYAPTGVGVLYGRRALLEAMPPYQGGGDMIDRVTFERTTYNDLPYKFEAGTPNIAGVIGLGAALDYLQRLGPLGIEAHERAVLEYASDALGDIRGLRVVGDAPSKVAVISFVMEGAHPNDIGEILDQHGVAIRTGHHCAQPVMDRFSVPATARMSLGLYNTREDIDALLRGLHAVKKLFS
ncbi:MAG: cysteine desulfurase [Deltaproteobacteria bacterium]|nr:cysteine desulfurase [Deltaproteobacteria bacterium]